LPIKTDQTLDFLLVSFARKNNSILVPKILTLFVLEMRVYKWQGNLKVRRKFMQHNEETAGKDVFLFLFVSVALWLLLFQSGLFN